MSPKLFTKKFCLYKFFCTDSLTLDYSLIAETLTTNWIRCLLLLLKTISLKSSFHISNLVHLPKALSPSWRVSAFILRYQYSNSLLLTLWWNIKCGFATRRIELSQVFKQNHKALCSLSNLHSISKCKQIQKNLLLNYQGRVLVRLCYIHTCRSLLKG